jgi:cyclopropane fatty-acyl-phospholipid synthase-like methyltransferase
LRGLLAAPLETVRNGGGAHQPPDGNGFQMATDHDILLSDNERRQRDYFDELALRREQAQPMRRSRQRNLEGVYSTIAGLPRNSTLLEIGCGDGSSGFTEYFISKSLKVTFLDISREAVQRLIRRLEAAGLQGYWALSGTLQEVRTELEGQQFDVIFFGDTLHHLTREETISLFKELRAFMHPESKLVAFEPNGRYPFWQAMPLINKEFNWELEKNIRHCTQRGFCEKCEAAGLRLETYRYQRFVPLCLIDKFRIFEVLDDALVRLYPIRLLSPYTVLVAGR